MGGLPGPAGGGPRLIHAVLVNSGGDHEGTLNPTTSVCVEECLSAGVAIQSQPGLAQRKR